MSQGAGVRKGLARGSLFGRNAASKGVMGVPYYAIHWGDYLRLRKDPKIGEKVKELIDELIGDQRTVMAIDRDKVSGMALMLTGGEGGDFDVEDTIRALKAMFKARFNRELWTYGVKCEGKWHKAIDWGQYLKLKYDPEVGRTARKLVKKITGGRTELVTVDPDEVDGVALVLECSGEKDQQIEATLKLLDVLLRERFKRKLRTYLVSYADDEENPNV
jgi:hypothetical protein